MNPIIKQIKEVYSAKGWNGVYQFLKKTPSIKYEIGVFNFGLHTSKTALKEKSEWLSNAGENEFRAHLYALGGAKNKSNEYTYNRIRGQQIRIN